MLLLDIIIILQEKDVKDVLVKVSFIEGRYGKCESLLLSQLNNSENLEEFCLDKKYQYDMCSIFLPEGITVLKEEAFCRCENLCFVSLPKSLVEIQNYCFSYCFSLKISHLPKGLKKIGEGAFFKNYNLYSISIPDGVEVLEEKTFANCECLQDV